MPHEIPAWYRMIPINMSASFVCSQETSNDNWNPIIVLFLAGSLVILPHYHDTYKLNQLYCINSKNNMVINTQYRFNYIQQSTVLLQSSWYIFFYKWFFTFHFIDICQKDCSSRSFRWLMTWLIVGSTCFLAFTSEANQHLLYCSGLSHHHLNRGTQQQ